MTTVPVSEAHGTVLPTTFPDPRAAGVYDSALHLIGNTPLVRLNAIARDVPGTVYVKLDNFNIGGSSKDRIGLNILRRALEAGDLEGARRIVETGQGNTSLGLAIVGVLLGLESTVVAKPDLAAPKLSLLRMLGADTVPGRLDVDRDHPENGFRVAEAISLAQPETWWSRQQDVTSNPEAHYLSTGPEIWQQTGGAVTHFVAAIATGGTVSGTGRYLQEQKPGVQAIGTTFDLPDKPWAEAPLRRFFEREDGYEDIEHEWPDNIDLDVVSRLEARTKGEAIDFAFRLARTEGLLLGPSSALSVRIALELAASGSPDDVYVVFSADHARDYATAEYDETWLREHDFGDIADRWFARH